MKEIEKMMISRATELLSSGEVKRVVGWRKGDFIHDPSPATFESVESLKDFVYNDFCGANLSKYLIEVSRKEGKTAVFLKPCDSYSFNELVKEHRINRENVLVIAIECQGKIDPYKLATSGIDGVEAVEINGREYTIKSTYGEKKLDKTMVLLERCLSCQKTEHAVADEKIIINEKKIGELDRYMGVANLEKMTPEKRYEFWRDQLSKCIRCNACRNVCPACSCIKCVFDNNASGVAAKANDDVFEEQLFHVIRAYHVSGRCTDCGECSRVCPERIPLHLLNRKFIKDINTLYGDYQAGETADGKHPVIDFTTEDKDPTEAVYREGK